MTAGLAPEQARRPVGRGRRTWRQPDSPSPRLTTTARFVPAVLTSAGPISAPGIDIFLFIWISVGQSAMNALIGAC